MSSPSQPKKPALLRYAIGLFVAVTCLRVWVAPIPVLESAQAQIPDSALQRRQVIETAKRTNQLLTEIKQILVTGTLNVRILGADNTGADNRAAKPTPRRRPGG